MKTVKRYLTNSTTGEIREEILTQIGDSNKYLAPDGYIYTKGALGWFCLNPNRS